jgi:hypothetical protein
MRLCRAVSDFTSKKYRADLLLWKGDKRGARERLHERMRAEWILARGCAGGSWADDLSCGVHGALTWDGEIEDGEQRTLLLRRRTAGQPAATPNLSSAMDDSNSSPVNGVSCHESDIKAMTRVIEMPRAKNLLLNAALSILSRSAALRRWAWWPRKLRALSTRLCNAGSLGAPVSPSWAAARISSSF